MKISRKPNTDGMRPVIAEDGSIIGYVRKHTTTTNVTSGRQLMGTTSRTGYAVYDSTMRRMHDAITTSDIEWELLGRFEAAKHDAARRASI